MHKQHELNFSAFGLNLRSIQFTDLEMIMNWRNDPKVLPFMDDSRKPDLNEMIYWFNGKNKSENYYSFLVLRDSSSIGFLEFKNIVFETSCCEVGIFLNPEYIGSGIFMSVYLIRELALKYLGINTIFSKVRKVNTRNIRIQKKFNCEVVSEDDDFYLFKIPKINRKESLFVFAKVLGYESEFNSSFLKWFDC